MLTVGGHDVLAPSYRQQVIFGHPTSHPFVVYPPSLVAQILGHPAISITAAVPDHDLLNSISQLHGFHLGFPLFPAAIKAGAANPRHVTHPLDTEVFLRLL